jgi:hypothetical protein
MRAVSIALAAIGGCALAVAVPVQLAAGDLFGAVWTLTGPGPFYAIGLVAVLRMPERPVTVWFIAAGATFAVEVCLGDAVVPALNSGSYLWVLAAIRVWVGTFSVVFGMGLIGLFPSGVTRWPAERWLVRAAVALAVLLPLLLLVADPVVPHGCTRTRRSPTSAARGTGPR